MSTFTQTYEASTLTRDGAIGEHHDEVVVIDQSTGGEFARHRVATRAQVQATVDAARVTTGPWWDLGFDGRAAKLAAWRRDIAEHAEKCVALIHSENGKPSEEARTEVMAVLGHLQWVIDNAERVLGRRDVPASPATANQEFWVERIPYGVVAVIGPWNFPLMTPGAIVIHAMAAGNAVVLKPSQITPAVGQWMVDSWKRAVPDFANVLNCLIGFGETGSQLIGAGVDKVAFTGSVRSGKAVAAQCATTLTPALLELGGNDGVIVAEDADLDNAAKHIAWGSMQNAGLGCISVEVAYVVESVHDDFVAKLVDAVSAIRVGSDDAAHIGPVPLPTQIPMVQHHIQDAVDRGATVLLGGVDAVRDSRYMSPTILDNVPADSLAATEETFGATIAIVTVQDTDEAVELINSGAYGLGSAVFSERRGVDIARRLRVGMTTVNDVIVISQNPGMPFGGRGDSGSGRKHGDEGLLEFGYPHSISVKTSQAERPSTTFERPPGAVQAALSAVARNILAGPSA